jgi:hypothetical protein
MFLGTGYLEPLSPRKPRKRFTSYEIKHWPKELTKGEKCGTLDVKREEPLGRAER